MYRYEYHVSYHLHATHLIKIIILPNQLLKLTLNIDNLLLRNLELHQRHSCLLQMAEKADFRRLQEHQTLTSPIRTSSPSDQRGGYNPSDRPVDRIVRSNPQPEYRALSPQRRYRSKFRTSRCRIRRKYSFVFCCFLLAV